MLIMMQIEDLLTDLGCTDITHAASVDEALSAIDRQSFSLATLDVNLGGVRSDDVAEALEDHDVPFAFSTGYGAQARLDGNRRHPLLNKPFSSARFNEVMSELLTSSVKKGALAAS